MVFHGCHLPCLLCTDSTEKQRPGMTSSSTHPSLAIIKMCTIWLSHKMFADHPYTSFSVVMTSVSPVKLLWNSRLLSTSCLKIKMSFAQHVTVQHTGINSLSPIPNTWEARADFGCTLRPGYATEPSAPIAPEAASDTKDKSAEVYLFSKGYRISNWTSISIAGPLH